MLRPRRCEDLPRLLELLQGAHEQHGYPVRQEAVSAAWLAAPGEVWSAVADVDGQVRGHVALHPPDPVALPVLEQGTGRAAPGLAMVSRLFTDGAVPGTGTALLAGAVERARAAGQLPVLQVDPDGPAAGFYLRRGWRRLGTARQQWGDRTVDAVVMVAG